MRTNIDIIQSFLLTIAHIEGVSHPLGDPFHFCRSRHRLDCRAWVDTLLVLPSSGGRKVASVVETSENGCWFTLCPLLKLWPNLKLLSKEEHQCFCGVPLGAYGTLCWLW